MKEGMPLPQKEKKDIRPVLDVLRRAAVMGMLGVATAQGAESAESKAYTGHAHEESSAETTTHSERASADVVTEAQIRTMLRYDMGERMFLGTETKLTRVAEGRGEWGGVSFSTIQELMDRGEGVPVIGHTHPLSVYRNVGYSTEEIETLRARGEAPAPMPPSFTDIIGAIDAAEHFRESDTAIRGRVYDPTGMWEYSVDEEHTAVRTFLRFREGLERAVNDALTAEEHAQMREWGIQDAHPAKRIEQVRKKVNGVPIAAKMQMAMMRFTASLPERTLRVVERFASLETLSVQLASAKRNAADSKQIARAIDTYITSCERLGISISYQAYQQ
ncbi:MAG: hypothetical protein QY311_00655 [Candidatus Paceibacterota bacterium]|nr:MAG: hypothetical protein QY311_00655 [Candidatus Paceibacterota bacterium]